MHLPVYSTVLVEPGCTANITQYGDVRIQVSKLSYQYTKLDSVYVYITCVTSPNAAHTRGTSYLRLTIAMADMIIFIAP